MAAKKKVKPSDGNDTNAPHDDLKTTDQHTTNSPSARRSRKRSLENVQTLPLDVSLQIFGHLHPKDLLNLTRTSKAFRSFFLNRATSISIWKSSLRQVEDLPEKPEFFSEPAFAHLAFSSVCQNCGMSGAHNPVWAWFVRYCAGCTKAMSCRFMQFSHPDSRLQGVVRRHGFELFNTYHPPGWRGGWVIHRPQLEDFIREWRAIDANDEDGRKALVEKQCRATKDRQTVLRRLRDWHTDKKSHRSAELGGLREQRLQEIMNRLQRDDSEWLPEMKHFTHGFIRFHINHGPAIRQAAPLTDRAWPKVLESLQERMKFLRARRIQEEREKQAKEQPLEVADSSPEH